MSMPTYEQIESLKSANPDTLLLFVGGECVRLFGEDADRASLILEIGIMLDQFGDSVLSFDRSDLKANVDKLVHAGQRAALCEQVVS